MAGEKFSHAVHLKINFACVTSAAAALARSRARAHGGDGAPWVYNPVNLVRLYCHTPCLLILVGSREGCICAAECGAEVF
jgi:hypothetical protein